MQHREIGKTYSCTPLPLEREQAQSSNYTLLGSPERQALKATFRL